METGSSVGGAGGDISLKVGAGDTGDGGQVSVEAGSTSSMYGLGGDVVVSAGDRRNERRAKGTRLASIRVSTLPP